MRELVVIISSSFLLLPPPNSSPPHFKKHRRRKPSPPLHWRPKSPNRPPLLSDTRRDLVTPSPITPPPAATRHLLKYYAALASKLAGNGRLDDFLMMAESVLVSDAIAACPSQFVARIDTKLVSRGISGVLRDRNLLPVLDFLSEVEKLGIRPSSLFDRSAMEALAVECHRLVQFGRVEEFVEVMERLAGYQFNIKNIVEPNDILKIFVAKHDPNMALRYASVLPHSQLLFCSIIHEFGKRKDLVSALNAYEAVKQKSGGFNMFACRSIIDVCGLCKDYLRSRRIFKEVLTKKITPNTYVFNSLMNVNSHDLNYTLHLYKQMQSMGVTVDMTSYNILLKACCVTKRVDLAQTIYKEIKTMASRRSLELDVITYSTIIKVFADAKMWQMALSIKDDMVLAGITPNIVTWSSLIGACANAGLVDRAVWVFEEMLSAGCEPNSQCCNILLNACVESYQYDRAFRLFYSWKESGFKIFHSIEGEGYVDTQGSVTYTTGNGEDQPTVITYDQPLRFAKVVPFRPTVATYNILMKACGTDYYHAKDLMDEMKIIGLSPNRISWSTLIDICGSSHYMRGAIQAFKTMRDVGIEPDVIAYTTAIKVCVENKNLKIAFSLFEEMKRFRVQPNLVTYNTLLRARSRYGSLHEVQQCMAIYQDMRKAGYNANDYFLKKLLEEWCEGVMCGNSENQFPSGLSSSCDQTYRNKPQSLLLEKVAVHLQKDIRENPTMDLRGLTKVEARIVVLSVLRMIKESYILGHPIKDDVIIITGMGKQVMGFVNHELEVQQAIIKVLRDELSLEVLTGPGSQPTDVVVLPMSSDVKEKAELPEEKKPLPRRPQDLGMLRVTRTSLYHWLQKSSHL